MKNKIIYILIILSIVAIVFSGYLLVKRFNKYYAYGNNNYYSYYADDKEVEEKEEVIESSSIVYETVINHENKYTDVEVLNANDAIALIKTDAENEEKKCNNNLSELEQTLYNSTNIYGVNFCELDEENATEIANTIISIYNDYPFIKDYVTNVTLVNDGGTGSYVAAFKPSFTFATSSTDTKFPFVIKIQVFLNSAYYLDTDYFNLVIDNAISTNHFPNDTTMSSLVAHEFGHVITYILAIKYYNSVNTIYLTKDNFDIYASTLKEYTSSNFSKMIYEEAYAPFKNVETSEEFRTNISNYANTFDGESDVMYNETIAEAFHDYYLHKSEAKEESKAIMNVLNKYIEIYG